MRLMLIALTQWCRTDEKSIWLSPYKTDLIRIHYSQSSKRVSFKQNSTYMSEIFLNILFRDTDVFGFIVSI